MISGNSERKIKAYIFIDDEGCGWTIPDDDEEIWGIPYCWHSENSAPFIEHRMGGFVTVTVNCSDISLIEFEI